MIMTNLIINCDFLLRCLSQTQLQAAWGGSSHSPMSWVFFLLAIGLTVLLGVIVYWRFREELSARLDNSHFMFRELCKAHDLNGSQCKLLQRLAGGLKLANPNSLFVDSSLWQIPEDGPGGKGLTKREWDRLLVIRRVLFLPQIAKPF
jgi:hypothetical protein